MGSSRVGVCQSDSNVYPKSGLMKWFQGPWWEVKAHGGWVRFFLGWIFRVQIWFLDMVLLISLNIISYSTRLFSLFCSTNLFCFWNPIFQILFKIQLNLSFRTRWPEFLMLNKVSEEKKSCLQRAHTSLFTEIPTLHVNVSKYVQSTVRLASEPVHSAAVPTLSLAVFPVASL